MKKLSLFASLALAAVIAVPPVAQAFESFVGLTGLYQNKADAFQGYTLITPQGIYDKAYLVDMKGDIVHVWNLPGKPMYAELLPNGNLLTNIRMEKVPVPFGGVHGRYIEMNWNGEIVWDVTINRDDLVVHHGFDRMPNGNTLMLAWEKKSWDDAVKAGRDPKTLPENGVVKHPSGAVVEGIWPDVILEVNPKGDIVWSWHVWEHLGVGPDKINPNYILNKKAFGAIYAGPDWTHFNAVRYNAETDKILCDSRNFGEMFIIDHKTGNIEWRFGNPGTYGGGKAPAGYGDDGDQQLFGCHDAKWLPNGNVSIFDNGTYRPSGAHSRVLEIDPKTNKIVWQFALSGRFSNSFYSSFQSAAQKLPNDNYFVTSTMNGHMFEVTPTKEVVWEYVSPVTKQGPQCAVTTGTNGVHRAFRYAPDYPAFKGKELKSQGPINAGCPQIAPLIEKEVNSPDFAIGGM